MVALELVTREPHGEHGPPCGTCKAAVSLSGNWICRTTWPVRVSTWPRRMPSWSCDAFTAVSRRVRRID
jgi:hypothetical protein